MTEEVKRGWSYRVRKGGLSSVRKLCLVSPSRSLGLTPKHMRIVDAFVADMVAPRGALSAS